MIQIIGFAPQDARLKSYVYRYKVFEIKAKVPAFISPPEARFCYVLTLHGETELHTRQGVVNPPEQCIRGVHTDATVIHILSDYSLTLIVEFYPHAFGCVSKDFASSVPDRYLDVRDTPLPWLDLSRFDLGDVQSFITQHLEPQLADLFPAQLPPDALHLIRAMELIRGQAGLVKVAQLAQELALTERSLNRYFMDYTGVSPKVLAELLRLQRVVHGMLAQDAPAGTSLAEDQGFHDYSHFLKTFKKLMGASPRSFSPEQYIFIRQLIAAQAYFV
ncbi:MAG: AraC family transcriptional regulator [Cytophagales bacterium]|nr:AraC family transcriptional regulator [Cytophagales bacterium]